MPALVNFRGDDDVCPGWALYSNRMDSNLFLSLAPNVDIYSPPPRKRSRLTAPSIFKGEIDQQEQHCSIEILPDECLFEILRRLPGKEEKSISACVSKRWLMLLSSIRSSEICIQSNSEDVSLNSSKKLLPGLNGDVTVEEKQEIDGNDYLTRCLEGKKATDVRLVAIAVGNSGRGGLGKLLIRGSNSTRGVTDLGLSAISRGCPDLVNLSMWDVPFVSDKSLMEIADGCPMLEKLDLCQCPLITDKGLMAIAQKCPNLTSLTLESCSRIGNEGLQAVGRYCRKLHSISIKDCLLVGDQGVASLVSLTSTSLTKIKLQDLNITDVCLAVIGHYGKAVIDLVFVGLQNLSERGFWAMGNALGMQKLKSLKITSCCGVTDRGLEALAKGCPDLKQLCLHRCCYLSDAGLKAFAEAARSLDNLQLEECNRITLVGVLGALMNCNSKFKALGLAKCLGIKDISSCPIPLPSCNSLRSLTIRDCPGFTSSSLAVVGKICPQLQHVDLSGLFGVTDDGLLPLIESSELGLVKVNVSGCINLTDRVISALVRVHGGTLQQLNLDGCKKVTDDSLLAVADSCSLLNDLDMSRCAVTDYGVAALASAKQLSLRVLSLSGCSKVTQRSLRLLGNIGRSLMGLNLQHCNLISTHAIGSFEERMWWCDILS